MSAGWRKGDQCVLSSGGFCLGIERFFSCFVDSRVKIKINNITHTQCRCGPVIWKTLCTSYIIDPSCYPVTSWIGSSIWLVDGSPEGVMGWYLCSVQNSHWSLNPNVMVFGDGAFGRWLGLDEVMGRALMMRLVSLWEETPASSPSLCHVGAERSWLSEPGGSCLESNQGGTLILDFRLRALWEYRDFYYLRHPVYGILLRQPELKRVSDAEPHSELIVQS